MRTSGEKRGQGSEWTHRLRMTIVFLTARQGEVVGGRKRKECCVVGEGGRQERCGGIVGYQKVLDEKERSWTKMTYRDTRKAAREPCGFALRNSVPF